MNIIRDLIPDRFAINAESQAINTPEQREHLAFAPEGVFGFLITGELSGMHYIQSTKYYGNSYYGDKD